MVLMNINANTDHIIARSNRVLCHDGRELRIHHEQVERWRRAIVDLSPPDWRFTENPRGQFLITVITDDAQINILGRSYRWNSDCHVLKDEVRNLAETRGYCSREKIEELAELYLNAQCEPDSEIYHDLKTVLDPRMPVYANKPDFCENYHTLAFADCGLDLNMAQRPNAILYDLPGSSVELWVRQGSTYSRPHTEDQAVSFCVFARLTKTGVVLGYGKLCRVGDDGVIEQVAEAECWPTPRPHENSIPPSFRSETYWQLPLHLDNWLGDLVFKAERQELGDDHLVSRLISVIHRVRNASQEIAKPRP